MLETVAEMAEESESDPHDAQDPPDVTDDAEDDEDEDIEYDDDTEIRPNMLPRPRVFDFFGHRFVTVVDVSGIHHLPVVKCTCREGTEEQLHYFELGLFPASYEQIKTVFTFTVLNDFRLSNLECKTSAYQYYSKLRRLTCPAFPKMVMNRYQELRRLSRQYRNLKLWKMHGRGYVASVPEPAEEPTENLNSVPLADSKAPLALFCPTCPQPSINLPETWSADPKWWLYIRKFCADGNFKADHLNQVNESDDVYLTEGDGFMTAQEPYNSHLKEASLTARKYDHVSHWDESVAKDRTQTSAPKVGNSAPNCLPEYFGAGPRRRMETFGAEVSHRSHIGTRQQLCFPRHSAMLLGAE